MVLVKTNVNPGFGKKGRGETEMKENKAVLKMKIRWKEFIHQVKDIFRSPIKTIGFFLILIDASLLIYGLFWGIITSLKSINNFSEDMFGLPTQLRFDNYITAYRCFYKNIQTGLGYERIYFPTLLRNSILFSTIPTIIELVTTASVAYVCSKYKMRFNKVLHFIVMFVLVFPGVDSLGNKINFLRTIGFYDSFFGTCFGEIIFARYNFLIWYGAFSGISNDYLDAARVDGAGNWRIMLTIAFPLVRIQFAILFLLGFVGRWNSYLATIQFTPSWPTLSSALFAFREVTANAASFPTVQIAACFIVALPSVVLYSIMSPYMIGNLTAGGLKG